MSKFNPTELRLIERIKRREAIAWYATKLDKALSENFIRQYKDEICWNAISAYQTLSESFIEEFKDNVNWFNICVFQRLSKAFIKKFSDKIKLSVIPCFYLKINNQYAWKTFL